MDQKHVLLIVGMNKVVKIRVRMLCIGPETRPLLSTHRDSVLRHRSKNGTCLIAKVHSVSAVRYLTRFCRVKGRFQIILVDEELDFNHQI